MWTYGSDMALIIMGPGVVVLLSWTMVGDVTGGEDTPPSFQPKAWWIEARIEVKILEIVAPNHRRSW